MNETINQLKNFYKRFSIENIQQLEELYDSDILFIDPFHEINGINQLKDYFTNLSQNLNSCQFNFLQECASPGSAFLQWKMEFSHPRIKAGLPQTVEGTTLLKFDKKITFHRDYFDSSEMLYKHIPIFSQVIKYVERRMAS